TWGLDAGQLVVWSTLLIYVALHARCKNRDVPVGLSLAAGSVKIATVLPFLMLLLGRKHGKALAAFGVAMLALCFCFYSPDQLPNLLTGHVENMRFARQAGEINDYTFSGLYHDDMLGLEHLLYCLGLRNAAEISLVQFSILLLMGLFLVQEFRSRTQPGD